METRCSNAHTAGCEVGARIGNMKNVVKRDLRYILIIAAAAFLLLATVTNLAWSQEHLVQMAALDTYDLTLLSLEDLMGVEVISASKKAEKLFDTAAAIYVINQEDIRRSGLHSIPELLRLVPGLQVARIDANKWAITSRGFNYRFVNKMLVLIDGRSVYTPLFSGVYWDIQDVLLEDIERIEVIRGPGATVWGANAVNGIINIITKEAADTQGNLLTALAGDEEKTIDGFRHGGKMGEDTYYRVYAKYSDIDNLDFPDGVQGVDAWDQKRAGFRIDSYLTEDDVFTLQGDIYETDGGQELWAPTPISPYYKMFPDIFENSGGNILARLHRAVSEDKDWTLQAYYDRTRRKDWQHSEERSIYDIDFQYRSKLSDIHELIWGAGYRYTSDNIGSSEVMRWNPAKRSDNLYSAFVQDEITLKRNRLWLIAGSKFEHNDYTGFEVQPNVRLLYTPHERQTVWAAVSRAVRTPSRTEVDSRISVYYMAPNPPAIPLPVILDSIGSPFMKSEKLTAYELGYRVQPADNVSLDIAAFYNVYDDVRSTETFGDPRMVMTPVPHLVQDFIVGNKVFGNTYGAELFANWNVSDRWKIAATYTALRIDMEQDPDSTDPWSTYIYEQFSPERQFSIRSYIDLPYNLEFDTLLFYVDGLSWGEEYISDYTRLDLRLGWRPSDKFETSIGVQNLLDRTHQEFGSSIGEQPTQPERCFYGKATWRF